MKAPAYVALAACVLGGCQLLVGIDETTVSNPGANDSGADAGGGQDDGAPPETSTDSADGGEETDSGPVQLECALVAGQTRTLLQLGTADGGETYLSDVWVRASDSPSQDWVVTQDPAGGYYIFFVDLESPNSAPQQHVSGDVVNVEGARVGGETRLRVYVTESNAPDSSYIVRHEYATATGVDSHVTTVMTTPFAANSTSSSSSQIRTWEADDSVSIALSSMAGTNRLYFGRYAGSAGSLLSIHEGDMHALSVFRKAGETHVFANEGELPDALAMHFRIDDGATVATQIPAHDFQDWVVRVANSQAPGRMTVLALSAEPAVRIGSVDDSAVSTFGLDGLHLVDLSGWSMSQIPDGDWRVEADLVMVAGTCAPSNDDLCLLLIDATRWDWAQAQLIAPIGQGKAIEHATVAYQTTKPISQQWLAVAWVERASNGSQWTDELRLGRVICK